jgi:hypothetical protein
MRARGELAEGKGDRKRSRAAIIVAKRGIVGGIRRSLPSRWMKS